MIRHVKTATFEDDGRSLKNAVGRTLANRAELFHICLRDRQLAVKIPPALIALIWIDWHIFLVTLH
jgi:hypothetical protein